MADDVEAALRVVETEDERAHRALLLAHAEGRDHDVGGAHALDLHHPHALAGTVGRGGLLRHDAFGRPAEPDAGVGGVGEHGGEADRALDAGHEALAALLVGPLEERIVVLGEEVEGHEGGRRLLGEARHARGGGVDALAQEVELLDPVALDHDLAVEHEPPVGEGGHGLDHLGEVAVHGLAVAALEEDLVAVAEHEGAEAVPLGLVAPPLALGNVGRGTGELGQDGGREREGHRVGRLYPRRRRAPRCSIAGPDPLGSAGGPGAGDRRGGGVPRDHLLAPGGPAAHHGREHRPGDAALRADRPRDGRPPRGRRLRAQDRVQGARVHALRPRPRRLGGPPAPHDRALPHRRPRDPVARGPRGGRAARARDVPGARGAHARGHRRGHHLPPRAPDLRRPARAGRAPRRRGRGRQRAHPALRERGRGPPALPPRRGPAPRARGHAGRVGRRRRGARGRRAPPRGEPQRGRDGGGARRPLAAAAHGAARAARARARALRTLAERYERWGSAPPPRRSRRSR